MPQLPADAGKGSTPMLETGEIIEQPITKITKKPIAEVAPNVAVIKTEVEVVADFAPVTATPAAEPVLDAAKTAMIYARLKNIEANGGLVKIAHACGATMHQVQTIQSEIAAALANAAVEE